GTLVTETGAGQWGHAVAWAARRFGLHAIVFWAGVSARQKPGRHTVIEMLGAQVHQSPSELTAPGKALLRDGRHVLGSLGTAIGEAISYAADHPETRYISGSNLPHVLAHQTVIGQEVKTQLDALGETPDTLIACVGGGSNLGGLMGPFLADKAERGDGLLLLGAESAAAPRLTRGAGEHWADLDSRVEESFAHRHQPRGFTFAATTAYRHYRLEITRNAGESGTCRGRRRGAARRRPP
ncbi:pyridoxal-phosphate dependent enzyme, partial [Streptomyces asiaticus]